MREKYSIEEILNAVNDLQSLKKDEKNDKFKIEKEITKNKTPIPPNTLKLIEEAEKNIKSK